MHHAKDSMAWIDNGISLLSLSRIPVENEYNGLSERGDRLSGGKAAAGVVKIWDEARIYKMKVQVVLEPSEEGGYTVVVPSLPGCISEGDTKDEALANIRKAIELYLEPVEDDLSSAPGAEIIEIAI